MPVLTVQPLPWPCRLAVKFAAWLVPALLGASPAGAADLVVRVGGLAAPLGSVGCSLFGGEAGFTIPADPAEWAIEIRVAS